MSQNPYQHARSRMEDVLAHTIYRGPRVIEVNDDRYVVQFATPFSVEGEVDESRAIAVSDPTKMLWVGKTGEIEGASIGVLQDPPPWVDLADRRTWRNASTAQREHLSALAWDGREAPDYERAFLSWKDAQRDLVHHGGQLVLKAGQTHVHAFLPGERLKVELEVEGELHASDPGVTSMINSESTSPSSRFGMWTAAWTSRPGRRELPADPDLLLEAKTFARAVIHCGDPIPDPAWDDLSLPAWAVPGRLP